MKLVVFTLVVFLSGCMDGIKQSIKDSNEIGETDIRYYADRTVTSLEVPPDLTKPEFNDNFNLDDIVSTADSVTKFDGKAAVKKITNEDINIEVKKNSYQSYLIVDKDADYVFNVVKKFLKDNGFNIVKEDKLIGFLETNYLQNKVKIPSKKLNFIQAALQNTIGSSYSLATIDKYRARIEEDNGATKIFLSLSSMREVVVSSPEEDKRTIWEEKPRDEFLETEMVYRLMLYMGSDDNTAKQKIEEAINHKKINADIKVDTNGFAKLQFKTNKEDAWDAVSFALDRLNIEITDQDKKDGSFYIKTANQEEAGFFSKIFGDTAIQEKFRILVRQLKQNYTEVYFIDLSGENSAETKKFSRSLFSEIKRKL